MRRTSLFLTLTATLLMSFAAWYLLRSPGSADFWLHRGRYEAIVQKIKRLDIAPGRAKCMYVNAHDDPASLSLQEYDPDSLVGKIEVMRTPIGQYQIGITTRDMGHLGSYGYVYTDAPTNRPSASGLLPSLDQKINAHWWIASNHLW